MAIVNFQNSGTFSHKGSEHPKKTSARDGQLMKFIFLDAESILLVDFLEGGKASNICLLQKCFQKIG